MNCRRLIAMANCRRAGATMVFQRSCSIWSPLESTTVTSGSLSYGPFFDSSGSSRRATSVATLLAAREAFFLVLVAAVAAERTIFPGAPATVSAARPARVPKPLIFFSMDPGFDVGLVWVSVLLTFFAIILNPLTVSFLWTGMEGRTRLITSGSVLLRDRTMERCANGAIAKIGTSLDSDLRLLPLSTGSELYPMFSDTGGDR